MNREEFCKHHWEYYLVLEKDFLATERYVSFELGDNYLYSQTSPTNVENSLTFSNEYIKQYQTICSEIDVIMKSICREFGDTSANNMKDGYTPTILHNWSIIKQQKVKMKDIELQPFLNWEQSPNYKCPDWWTPYNRVKHERVIHYKKANLKNLLNALAGLFILENYFVKYIGDRDNDMDVPDDNSQIFEMVDYSTRVKVIKRITHTQQKQIQLLWLLTFQVLSTELKILGAFMEEHSTLFGRLVDQLKAVEWIKAEQKGVYKKK